MGQTLPAVKSPSTPAVKSQTIPAAKPHSEAFSEVDKVVQVFGCNMSKDNMVVATSAARKPCPDYRRGHCKYGDRCKFLHA